MAVLSLLTLLYTVVNQSFGFIAMESTIPPEDLIAELGLPPETELADLDAESLVSILEEHVSRNAGRRLERDQRFFEDRLVFEPQDSWDALCAGPDATPGCTLPARDQASIYQLVLERVVEPNVVATWSLSESLLDRDSIEAEVAESLPQRSSSSFDPGSPLRSFGPRRTPSRKWPGSAPPSSVRCGSSPSRSCSRFPSG